MDMGAPQTSSANSEASKHGNREREVVDRLVPLYATQIMSALLLALAVQHGIRRSPLLPIDQRTMEQSLRRGIESNLKLHLRPTFMFSIRGSYARDPRATLGSFPMMVESGTVERPKVERLGSYIMCHSVRRPVRVPKKPLSAFLPFAPLSLPIYC